MDTNTYCQSPAGVRENELLQPLIDSTMSHSLVDVSLGLLKLQSVGQGRYSNMNYNKGHQITNQNTTLF